MSKGKKNFKDTDFGKFIGKVGSVLPEVGEVALSVVGGNYVGAVSKVGKMIKEGIDKKNIKESELTSLLQEFEMFKMNFEKECFEMEAQDRENARELYKEDSSMQKIFGIFFLFAYSLLSWYLLDILLGEKEIPKLAETMITMIWTGTSTKLSTIVDFFFGGSVK